MKKLLTAAMLVLIATGSLFAERILMIQGTYLNTSRTYEDSFNDEFKKSYGEAGLNFTTFNGRQHGIGLYTSATFLIPVEYSEEINGSDLGVDIDDMTYTWDELQLGLDMLLGVGFLAPVTPRFSVLVAGGLHFNGIALITSWHTDNYLAYNLGPGAAVNGILYLTRRLSLNISAMAAWDALEFVTIPELGTGVEASGGFTWALSAGLGLSY